MSDLLQQIYAVFNPAPLKPGQQELYVNLDDVRGSVGIVSGMVRKIRLAGEPTCQVLTGHKGCGKSTELWQLRHVLENPDDGSLPYFVVSVTADDHLDRNDVDFPDVLIAIVREIAAQLHDRLKISLKPGYFRDRLQRLKKFFSNEVEIDDLSLDVGFGELSAKIKHSPDARSEIRKLLEPDADNWLKAANDVIGDAITKIQGKKLRGLVVIVDGLDKIIAREHDTAKCLTTEYLFVHRSAQLTAFQCHVIYTLPIELAYSHHQPKLRALYGGDVPVVPMTKIATSPPKSRTYGAGVRKFGEIIAARLAKAGASKTDLFASDKVRDDLIKLSGGQPDELVRLVREGIIVGGLPIAAPALKRCRENLRRSYRRQLRSDHWPVILQVRATGQVARTDENEQAFRELLDSRTILLYVNDEEWYGLNPAIADLEPPEPPPDQSSAED